MKQLFAALLAVFMLNHAAVAAQNPQELAQETIGHLLTALDTQKETLKANPAKVYKLVDDILLPHFDFKKMAQLVLGRHWRSATPDQQAQFTTAFRDLLVRTYATSLIDYSGQKVDFKPMQGDPGSERRVTISAEVQNPGSTQPLRVDTEMYLPSPEQGWKVYDVKVAEVSLVTNYRSSYDEEIRKNGLDQLIASMTSDNSKAFQTP
jgi:phospholipid transport system substrate-binding protein